MVDELWPIALQTILIVLAVLASYVRLRERITALEVTSGHQGESIDRMIGQVDGLSRHVAKLDGAAGKN